MTGDKFSYEELEQQLALKQEIIKNLKLFIDSRGLGDSFLPWLESQDRRSQRLAKPKKKSNPSEMGFYC